MVQHPFVYRLGWFRRIMSIFSPITHFTDKRLFIAIQSTTSLAWLRVKKKYLWRIERATPKCVASSGHGPWDNHGMRESENDSVVDVSTHNDLFFSLLFWHSFWPFSASKTRNPRSFCRIQISKTFSLLLDFAQVGSIGCFTVLKRWLMAEND